MKKVPIRLLNCRDCILQRFYGDRITLVKQEPEFTYEVNIPDYFSETFLRDVCEDSNNCDDIRFNEVQSVTKMAPSMYTSMAYCIAVDYRYLTEVATCQDCLNMYGSYMRKNWMIIDTFYYWMFWYYPSTQHSAACSRECGGIKTLSRAYCARAEPQNIDLNEIAEEPPYHEVHLRGKKNERAKCFKSLAKHTHILARLEGDDASDRAKSCAVVLVEFHTYTIEQMQIDVQHGESPACTSFSIVNERPHQDTKEADASHLQINRNQGIDVEASQCLYIISATVLLKKLRATLTENLETNACLDCINNLVQNSVGSDIRLISNKSSFVYLPRAPHRGYIADRCGQCLSITVFPNEYCQQTATSSIPSSGLPATKYQYLVLEINWRNNIQIFYDVVLRVVFHTDVYLVTTPSDHIHTSVHSLHTIASICAAVASKYDIDGICSVVIVDFSSPLRPLPFTAILRLLGITGIDPLELARIY